MEAVESARHPAKVLVRLAVLLPIKAVLTKTTKLLQGEEIAS